MEDITPSLVEKIEREFRKNMTASAIIRGLSKKISDSTVTYKDAERYAREVGNIRAKSVRASISADDLPNGRMYYNIAKGVVNNCAKTDYGLVQKVSKIAQKNKNKQMKVGLNPIDEKIDQENIDSIIDMISASENYDDYSKQFEIALATFAKTVVDRNMKANATFQNKAGIKIVIVRTAGGNCCDWCAEREGTFNIGDAPDDVWGHHNGCSCYVDYGRK